MNYHGQPTGPEFAMLAELHARVEHLFGERVAPDQPQSKRRPLALAAVVVMALAAVVVRVWG